MEFLPTREVAVQILGFSIHWYGIMYLLAFVAAYVLVFRFQHFRGLSLEKEQVSSILSWAVAGVIIGGRLGFVLFYEPAYFLSHPLHILYVWEGGMSSHGGFIGVAVALWYALRTHSVPVFKFMDVAVVPIAVGLALGRLGNFINFELYGTVTTLPWGMEIPGVEGLRHPTFFYAMIKNLWIAAVCLVVLRSQKTKEGTVLAIFLLMYGTLRFVVEFFREQSHDMFEIALLTLTRGQLLSIPVMIAGVLLLLRLRR